MVTLKENQKRLHHHYADESGENQGNCRKGRSERRNHLLHRTIDVGGNVSKVDALEKRLKQTVRKDIKVPVSRVEPRQQVAPINRTSRPANPVKYNPEVSDYLKPRGTMGGRRSRGHRTKMVVRFDG